MIFQQNFQIYFLTMQEKNAIKQNENKESYKTTT